ncbi:MAG: O-acetyl-ADP-ribose deacetylase [Chitinophagaceae bacterium]
MPHHTGVALLFPAFITFVLMIEKIFLLKGDITKQKVDAIVNAANSALMGGGGVDGAIHRAGGPSILEECRKIIARQGSCKTGEAVITTAGNLPAKFVLHTVGPVWNNGNNSEAKKLSDCYRNSLQLAVENKLSSIAFPNISTGIYGYPKKEAAVIAIKTVSGFIQNNPAIHNVYFVCFDEENFSIYKKILASTTIL